MEMKCWKEDSIPQAIRSNMQFQPLGYKVLSNILQKVYDIYKYINANTHTHTHARMNSSWNCGLN
jgi:hypothetical protein